MSGEQLSPLDDSDYREIAEEIAAEEMKETDERLPSGEQLSPLDDSDYREIEEEITQEMRAEIGAEVIPEERKDEEKRSAVLKRVYSFLSRYPIAWFAIGVVAVVIITVLFFKPLRCVLELRLDDATVTLIGFLVASVAGMTFIIAPPQIDKVLQSLYGGFAVTFIIVVITIKCLPPPSWDSCFGTGVLTPTAAPVPTYTMTPTSTETPTNTPLPTPTPTLAARATRVWKSVAILSPSDDEEVSIRTHALR